MCYFRYILLVLLLFFVTACPGGCEAPGEGETAERGYFEARPVIDALEAYFSKNKVYPDTLKELVPEFIKKIPTKAPDAPLEYSSKKDSYTLRFRYSPPGMNKCEWTSESKKWECSGYY